MNTSGSRVKSVFERYFIEYIELWLSGLGVVLIWAIPQLITPEEGDRWRTTAITAILIGVIHGVIFWIIRRRRQKIKAHAQELIEQENARLEQRVWERTDQVRRLASELGMAEQRERHRLAVVLHDHVQQLLFSIQMRVQSLVRGTSHEAVAPDVEAMNNILGKAIDSTRELSLELSPPVLAGEGLDQALQWLAFHMSGLHQIDIRFENHAANAQVDEAMRVLLFQVVRELLARAVEDLRQSQQARNQLVSIMLEDNPDELKISVQGLQAHLEERSSPGGHRNIERLRERLYFVGGLVEEYHHAGQLPAIVITAPRSTQPPVGWREDSNVQRLHR
ncbi:hypothetical protein F6455_03495 [Proteobacteria bacterium 005FR1]|nr:hypothetical protein [Proteobacteria bacterium 005FR1]